VLLKWLFTPEDVVFISHYMRQILEALKYCHSKNIVHGDLRPHYLLLANRENSAPVKISGFGSIAELDPMGTATEGKWEIHVKLNRCHHH